MSKPPTKLHTRRCAIYTRKSSDEGLDQAFNSLDAQREAGEAYVKSQASEGWTLIATRYDDGGYSGGSMERPALRQLLGDLEAGRVDVIVVYKIDRLTRSLADFARIVERLDAHSASFVSVTQAFNTTSSMGRLTLNVLLSFAQFEREVTGERIRDKIAASKARGMWMGGVPPLGYDMPAAASRMLRVNEDEAITVHAIYERYLEVKSVHRLADILAGEGTLSKRHVTAAGRVMGGVPFGRGALFHLLRNRTYLGEIVHKDVTHPGEHFAIVPRELFDRVQMCLGSTRRRANGEHPQVAGAALIGKLFDATGELMTPAHARGRTGRIYRYYVSSSLQRGEPRKPVVQRLPAPAIEAVVSAVLERLLPEPARSRLKAVHVQVGAVRLVLGRTSARLLRDTINATDHVEQQGRDCIVTVALDIPLRGGRRSVLYGARDSANPDPVMIAALRKARSLIERDARSLPVIPSAPTSPYERCLLRLALLAPDIQSQILTGQQPPGLNLERLIHGDIPLGWSAQAETLGFIDQRKA